MPINIKTGKMVFNGEPGTPLGEQILLRKAVERQNEILEQIAKSLSIKETISTKTK